MYNGVLNIYKEKGYTSHDVVARLRGILHQKKIGHTGTLDPDAAGVLPVCLGQATRLADMLTDKTKTYEAVLLLGRETDTQDVSGQILAEAPVTVSPEEVRAAAESFEGAYEQVPPMYSALKVGGKKLYQLARQGRVVERQARPVTIYRLTVEEICLPRVRMTVCCSKGTYIRTLCHDIGQKLGCGGCMEELLRTQVERFLLADSLTLDQVEQLRDRGELESRIVSVEEMFAAYPPLRTLPECDGLARNGNPAAPEQVQDAGAMEDGACFRMYDSGGTFWGIYQYQDEKRRLKPWKMFPDSAVRSREKGE